MKQMLTLFVIILSLISCADNQPQRKYKKKSEMTSEEIEQAKLEMYRRSGGMVLVSQKGTFRIISMQRDVSAGTLEKVSAVVSKAVKINVSLMQSDVQFEIEKAAELLNKTQSDACLFIVDSKVLPMSLLAPEAKWALVNVAPLRSDNPDSVKLSKRTQKMVIRTSALLLGAATSKFRGSALESIVSLRDIDNMSGNVLLPDSLMSISSHLPKLGIQSGKIIPYRIACQQGLAPAPTNDVQKTIWEEVHAPPKNPIKIEFDAKKGR